LILAVCLLLLSAGLVLLEVLFPSFGILGLSAATAYGFALVSAFRESQGLGFTILFLGLILLPFVLRMGIALIPKTPVGRKLLLSPPEAVARGTGGDLIGMRGLALTDLRPAGTAEIAGRRLDVVTGGAWIGKGRPVRVVDVEGSRIVVEDGILSEGPADSQEGTP
jgi:membrane-bound serine protease (ClpP class)